MERDRNGILYLVVPCYNEEDVIASTISALTEKMNRLIQEDKISLKSKVMFVNDGSKDRTLQLLHEAAAKDALLSVLSFSRNYGHQSAILAGMMTSMQYADMVVTIDADLQQDIEALDRFLECYYNGCDIVYGVRNNRESDGFFKKMSALCYYRFLHFLGCKVITNHADYRLMSKRALEALSEFKESNLFMRGLVPMLGFQSGTVYFDVKKREAGESKYTLRKMMTLAIDGITSLSIKPLHIITVLGLLVVLFSIVMAVITFIDWAGGNVVPGYTTTMIVSAITSGVTLLSLGIIGEYIGKIYLETKDRPRYIIESFVWTGDEEHED